MTCVAGQVFSLVRVNHCIGTISNGQTQYLICASLKGISWGFTRLSMFFTGICSKWVVQEDDEVSQMITQRLSSTRVLIASYSNWFDSTSFSANMICPEFLDTSFPGTHSCVLIDLVNLCALPLSQTSSLVLCIRTSFPSYLSKGLQHGLEYALLAWHKLSSYYTLQHRSIPWCYK